MKLLMACLLICFVAIEVGLCAEGGRGGKKGGGRPGGGWPGGDGGSGGVPGEGRPAGGWGGDNAGRGRDRTSQQNNPTDSGATQQDKNANQPNPGNNQVEKNAADQRAERNSIQAAREAAEQKDRNENREEKGNVDALPVERKERIQYEIAKGYLTESELAALDERRKEILELESSYRFDGKLTKDDYVVLRKAINNSSACVWAETIPPKDRHSRNYRFGRNVFAQNAFSAKLQEEDDFSRAEAKSALRDFREALRLKRDLAAEELPAEQRTQTQNEFNDLLNKYFELR